VFGIVNITCNLLVFRDFRMENMRKTCDEREEAHEPIGMYSIWHAFHISEKSIKTGHRYSLSLAEFPENSETSYSDVSRQSDEDYSPMEGEGEEEEEESRGGGSSRCSNSSGGRSSGRPTSTSKYVS